MSERSPAAELGAWRFVHSLSEKYSSSQSAPGLQADLKTAQARYKHLLRQHLDDAAAAIEAATPPPAADTPS